MATRIEIHIRTLTGRTIDLNVDPKETLDKVKEMICEQESISPDLMRLVFAGKALENFPGSRINEFSIQEGSTLHLLLRLGRSEHRAELVSNTSAAKSHTTWQKMAKEGDFDEDLHIVDPQSHFHLLERLERDITARSELCRTKANYNIHENSEMQANSPHLPGVPARLLQKLEGSIMTWTVSASEVIQ